MLVVRTPRGYWGARDITPFSANPEEEETIFVAHTLFEVERVDYMSLIFDAGVVKIKRPSEWKIHVKIQISCYVKIKLKEDNSSFAPASQKSIKVLNQTSKNKIRD